MEFRILGPLELWDAGRSFSVRGTRQRALLAMLLLRANEVVSTDRLLGELWGAELPTSGAKALQVRISQLRKALPRSDVVETRPSGYVIRLERGQLDLHRFEGLLDQARGELARGEAKSAAGTARRALAVWRGSPLEDLASAPFLQGEIRRLEELRLAALELQNDADLALGRHGALISELEALVLAHPLRERLREQLMLALYRSGRQAEALAEFQEARGVLVDQLGIDPGTGLQRLQKAILLHEPELEWREPARDTPERSILLVVEHEADVLPLLTVAEPLARALGPRELLLMGILSALDGGDLRSLGRFLEGHHTSLARRGTKSRTAVLTSSDPGSDVARFAADVDADLLLIRSAPELLRRRPLMGELALVLAESPCDVAVLLGRDNDEAPLSGRPVVVPFGGSEHEWTALELGVWLADGLKVPLQLVGTAAVPGEGRRDASRLLANAALVVQRLVDVAVEPVLAPRGTDGVAAASAAAGILVMGFPDRWRQVGLGDARHTVAARTPLPVLVVRRGVRPGGLAPRESLTHFTWSLESAQAERLA